MAPKKQAAKTATPEEPKAGEPAVEKPKAAKKSVVAGLDIKVRDLTDEIEKAAAQVGGDIPRGFATSAVSHLREAQELLYKAEREDR